LPAAAARPIAPAPPFQGDVKVHPSGAIMSISGLSSSSLSVYLQYLTGSSDSDTSSISELFSEIYSADSSSPSSTTSSTTSRSSSYLEQAAEGTVLTDTGQKAAQAELEAKVYGSLFDLTV
jgi:hypothetical protein